MVVKSGKTWVAVSAGRNRGLVGPWALIINVFRLGRPVSAGANIGIFLFFRFRRRFEPDIANMGCHNQDYCERKQQQLVGMPVLLGEQEKHAGGKQHEGNIAAVVPDKAMAKGQDPEYKGKNDHAGLKEGVVDDIDT